MSAYPLLLVPFLFQAPGDAPAPSVEVVVRALPEPSDAVDAAIGAGELYAHVAYLASDELEGRFTGSSGGLAAAEYLAKTLARLEPMGLQPAGDVEADGTHGYLQDVQLAGVGFDALPELELAGSLLTYGADFNLRQGFALHGELSLLGVTDEAALPAEPNPAQVLYLDMTTPKSRAVLAGHDEAWVAGWGAVIQRGGKSAGRLVADAAGITRVRGAERPLVLEVSGDGRAGLDSAPAGATLRFAIGGEPRRAYNVLGLLPATTSLAAGATRESVVISAHYDHLRRRAVADGEDGIYNGADDDASGVAAVLEIVEALALSPEPRGRDLIVLLATGEEIGLVGTSYYLDHPVAPLDSTSCNLNFEMIGRSDPLGGGPGALWLTGYGHTNLGTALAAKGLEILQDPRPEQHFFERSDNYAFVLKGVVGQTLSTYNLHEDYHHVSDEVDTLEYEHMRAACEVGLGATRQLLDTSFVVAWSPDYSLPRR